MMTNKRVNVLISSYNGEKYISDQIKSILDQTYKNIKIYVRDDGSTDGTIDLLKEYERKGDIKLILGENVRWGRSFMSLLKISEDGDYWAFCDQDDIWLPDKIRRAVKWFESQNDEIPLLYHGSYKLVSEDLKKTITVRKPPSYKLDFRRSLTECMYQGFSTVVNKKCRDMMLLADIDKIYSHDQWAGIIVTKFGTAYFDPKVTSLHRRLDTSMSSEKLISRFKWLKRVFKEGSLDIKTSAQQYVSTFGMQYIDDDLKYAKLFVFDKYSLNKSIYKAFYPARWRPIISSEIVLRLLMLIGRV